MAINLSEKEINSAIARAKQNFGGHMFILPILFGGLYTASQIAYYSCKDDNRAVITGLKVDGGYDANGQKVRPAAVTDTPLLPDKNKDGSGLLIVDDIIGTGETLSKVLELYPNASVLVPTYWPDGKKKFQSLLDERRLFLGIEIPQGQFVNFPWEEKHPDYHGFMQRNSWYAEKRANLEALLLQQRILREGNGKPRV